MSLQVSTQWALYKLNIIVIGLLLYSTHSNLMHVLKLQTWQVDLQNQRLQQFPDPKSKIQNGIIF
jgi:hypothetical protein